MKKVLEENKNVLVGVIKNRRDFRILLKDGWYRIPLLHMPKRKFSYIAFYQPTSFGKNGKRIEYYARAGKRVIVQRIYLLPKEKDHPRAHDMYAKIECNKIQKLPKTIKNISPRRVSFGFTTLKSLLTSKNILELYGVPETEEIIKRELQRAGIKAQREFSVSVDKKRYRIDFAVFSKKGNIAIECDNKKAHGGNVQKNKDKIKTAHLRCSGWRVVRLKEKDIIEHPDVCISKIKKLT
jgi:very-short-patch-repair endonuclease